MPAQKRSFLEIEDFSDLSTFDQANIQKKINNQNFDNFDVNYLETLTDVIPSSIPHHSILGSGKVKKSEEKEQCLYTQFSKTLTDRYISENPLLLLNKYEGIMNEFSSSLVRMVFNGSQVSINKSAMKQLIDVCNISIYEMNTWILIKFIIMEFIESSTSHNDEETGLYNEIKNLLYSLGDVKYYNTLARWLEKCSNIRNKDINIHDIKMLSDTTGYRYASQKFLILHENNLKDVANCIVTELDPDAPQRLNLPLVQEDLNNENSFYALLFRSLRCGQTSQFLHLCRHSGQLWRTLTLLDLRNMICRKDADINEQNKVLRNLQYYDLWRESAWKLSCDTKSNIYERAIYGVFSGNIDAVLPVCETFEDHLWANLVFHVTNSIQKRIFNALKHDQYNLHDIYNLDERFYNFDINSLWGDDSAESSSISYLFHSLQKLIIIKKQDISPELEAYVKLWSRNPLIMLFLTHYAILFRPMVVIRDSTYSLLINSYIESLIVLQKYDLISLYASYIPKQYQIDSYISVLKRIKPKNDKLFFIKAAKIHGLDCLGICKKISSTVVENYLQYIDKNKYDWINSEETDYVLDVLDYVLIKGKTRIYASFLILRMSEYFIINDNLTLGAVFLKKFPISMFASLKNDMLSFSHTDIPIQYYLIIKKYKYLHRILELHQIILSCVNNFGFKIISDFVFIRQPLAHDDLMNSRGFDDLSQRLINKSNKTIWYSIKWINCLSKHDFSNCIEDIPYSNNIYRSECFNLVKKFTPKIVNIIYNIHHYRNDHVKCLEVSHFVADFPQYLLEGFSKNELKELLDKCADCFTLIDFSNK